MTGQDIIQEVLTVCVEGHHQGFIQTRVVHDAFDGQVAEQPGLEE